MLQCSVDRAKPTRDAGHTRWAPHLAVPQRAVLYTIRNRLPTLATHIALGPRTNKQLLARKHVCALPCRSCLPDVQHAPWAECWLAFRPPTEREAWLSAAVSAASDNLLSVAVQIEHTLINSIRKRGSGRVIHCYLYVVRHEAAKDVQLGLGVAGPSPRKFLNPLPPAIFQAVKIRGAHSI
jgi:hypothetical protein